jgi:polyferredoxin
VQKLAAMLSLQHVEAGWILAGSGLAWAILAAALIVGWFIPRVFCRYVCPYSVLLGLLAAVGFWRRKIDTESCIQCSRCVTQCPVQAIQPSADGKAFKLSSYQCVQCGLCSGVCKRQAV